MTKAPLSQLAVAKRLAEESGRPLADCMQDAAEIIIREQRKPRLPRVRTFYLAFAGLCLALIANAAMVITGSGPHMPVWASSGLLVLALVGIFWIAPEMPLLSRLWTRWTTPAFIVAMIFGLALPQPAAMWVVQPAMILFFVIAFLAAMTGAKNPELALDRRLFTTEFMFHKLSPEDQGRIFFLAPWLSPFRWR